MDNETRTVELLEQILAELKEINKRGKVDRYRQPVQSPDWTQPDWKKIT